MQFLAYLPFHIRLMAFSTKFDLSKVKMLRMLIDLNWWYLSGYLRYAELIFVTAFYGRMVQVFTRTHPVHAITSCWAISRTC
jgi:hypothetical protein